MAVKLEPTGGSSPPSPTTNATKWVTIRKTGDKYTADPSRVTVQAGEIANIAFVLENAPPNAQLIKLSIIEKGPLNTSNPFSLPGPKRVFLLVDDNANPANNTRSFDYELEVQEDPLAPSIIVDPGIDNDPPN